MRYNVEPLRITESNIFGRTSAESSGVRLEDVEKDNLEEVLRSMPSLDGFYLTAKLQISLEAKVLRNLKPGLEIVRLSSDDRSIDLLRDVAGKPGDIGVSCDPNGDEVPVDSLNIKFRDYDDSFTDRGIVWVFPGDLAGMHFFVKAQALKTPGLIAEIVTAAEEALKIKVLAHF